MNLLSIFITGLTVGGLTCLAVQGGLLASVIASREKEDGEKDKKYTMYATVSFLVAKLISYTLLGALLGVFGNALNIKGEVQTIMQLLAGIYMLIIALNLLDVHPVFRYAIIQPPRFLARLVKNQSKSKGIFAPALLGLMTIFIPCGTTMAMETLAISSASSLTGALIMAVFILGTIPLFLGTGFLISFLGETFRTKFFKGAAILLILLGLTSINGALVAFGSPIHFPSFSINDQGGAKETVNQNVTIEITSRGYTPNYIKVKKGSQVTVRVVNRNSYSCASAFRVPKLRISYNLQPGQEQTFTFTPKEKGEIPFSCSMGMYRGIIEVI